MVFFHHQNQTNLYHLPTFLFDICKELHVGVTVFFVLSGFLITYRYYHSVTISKHWLRKYLVNRVARIYPMYLLLTACAFLFQFLYMQEQPGSFAIFANLFLLKGFFNNLKFSCIAQSWSLTVEECFYFSAPFIFLFQKKTRKCFLLIFIILGLGFLLVQLNNSPSVYGFMENNKFMLVYTFFGRCFEFFIGIYLALFLKNRRIQPAKNRSVLFTLTGITSFSIVLILMAITANTLNVKFSIYSYTGIFLNNIILPLTIAVIFYGLIIEQSYVKKILERPLFQLLGKSSYIFYLVHLGFLSTIIELIFPISNVYINVLVLFISLNLVSILLYKLAEEPLRVLIKKLFMPHTLVMMKK